MNRNTKPLNWKYFLRNCPIAQTSVGIGYSLNTGGYKVGAHDVQAN